MTTTARSTPPNRLTEPETANTFMFLGIALVVLGMVATVAAVLTTFGTVILFGALLVAAGISQAIHIFRAWGKERVLLHVLSSLAYLVAGGIMLFNPLLGAMGLTVTVGIFLVASGILRLVRGIRNRKEKSSGWFLFGGILDLVMAGLIAYGWPVTALWVIGLFVGISTIMHGAAWIIVSSAASDIRHRDELDVPAH
jgi:uncharacterized membrane protein HdeD (DUF308 family)